MKKILPLFLLFTCCICKSNFAQKKKPAAVSAIISGDTRDEKNTKNNQSGGSKELKIIAAEKVMEMKIPAGGANGAAVIYHPKEKLYYAAQAGNKLFPLVIFNKDGDIVSEETQETLIDVRGLWYNPKTKQISGNGYDESGWFHYDLNKKGLPEKIDIFKEGLYQPDKNSGGVLNTEDEEILFLDGLNIACYNTNGTEKKKTIQLHIGSMHSNDGVMTTSADFEKNYNVRSLVYTGIKGAEIGLLNVSKKQVELYNMKTGYMSQIVQLPLDFVPETFFNFSYCNEIYWVFDKTNRKWKGYK
ncbi:MAG: hypothetical protein K2Q24_12560 [Chitinophagaceae bacterium]|jgi:hypothetical protein|nr:hypothetical protein [Chitinophagaceae bacterium]